MIIPKIRSRTQPPTQRRRQTPRRRRWCRGIQEIPGGVQTTDPTFADGAQEVDTYSNQPREEPAAE